MSRRHAQTGPSISLFPFLAVLLCTMGSLLVLLVLFSHSAQEADSAAEQEAVRQQQEELTLARDELAWRLEQLQGVRERTAEDLARARMQLAGIEDSARELIDEFHSLEQTAAALAADAEATASPPADEESVESLELTLAEAREALESAREEAAMRPPAYAVVPYAGDKGTHRRPLYIECCIDGVFLQPEGIRLRPSDFEGPPGPGNPLASGLRAAREYLADRPGESGDPAAQPYPLLLVRPSGVMAYYAARESLQSWGSDFGYQFIDEDWTLTFPPADPALAEAESRAIEDARRRLAWLAEVGRPQRSRPKVQYRAATTRGGVVSTGGPSVLGDQSRFDWTEEQAAAAAAGRGFRAGTTGGGQGQGDAVLGNGRGGGQADSGLATGRGVGAAAGGTGDRYLGPSKFYDGSGSGRGGTGAGGLEGAAAGRWNTAEGGEQAGLPAAGPSGSRAAGGESAAGGTADGVAGVGAGDGVGPGAAGGDGSGTGSDDATTGGSGGAAGTPGLAAAGGGGDFGPGMPGITADAATAGGAAGGAAASDCGSGGCSLAGRRGSNWASLATRDRSIPLTRPIRLECAADELRILGSGGRVATRIPVTGDTVEAVDPLVREVHATVTGWGMAGDRMYWKPELVLSATADGDDRRADLEQLLTDSGLDTRRAEQADTVRRLPPVRRTGGLFRSR